MDIGTIIVVILRLLVPLSILRWPLAGFAASWLLDVFDGPLAAIINPENLPFGYGIFPQVDTLAYNLLDKWLDLYFLFFAFLVAFGWQNVLARRTVIILFVLRFLGVILFSLTGSRYVLFFFPNLIELFFPYYLITTRWFLEYAPDTLKKLLIILGILLVPKLVNEYLVHVLEFELVDTINFFAPFEIQQGSVLDWLKYLFGQH